MIALLLLMNLVAADFYDVAARMNHAERVARANELLARVPGENAAPLYEKAIAAFKSHWELQRTEDADPAEGAIWDSLDYELILGDAWTSAEARVAEKYLSANAECLAILERATTCPAFRTTIKEGGLISAPVGAVTNSQKLARLSALRANQAALRGDWPEAWSWNVRAARVAGHICQAPEAICVLTGAVLERRILDQAARFVRRAPGRVPADLLEQLADARRHAAESVSEFDILCTVDAIVRLHAWADGAADEDVASLVEFASGALQRDFPDLPASPFSSADAVRAALKKTSIAEELAALRRAAEVAGRWHKRPFHEAWKDRAVMRREVVRATADGPTLRVLDQGFFPPGRFRRNVEHAAAQRSAFRALIALHQQREKAGRWPARLEDLKLRPPPLDPFSGKLLGYRLTDEGRDFILYSVGDDQVDDLGRPVPESGDVTRVEDQKGDIVYWPVNAPSQ